MNPQIIKLSSGDTYYANADLIKSIKQVLAQPSGIIKPDDNIYFFPDVTFQRSLLTISQEKFSRVIKLEKANAIVVNSDIYFPNHGLALKNNKLDGNCPPGEADDILFNISMYGAKYVDMMMRWMAYFKLTNKPQVVFESKLIEFVNSGIVINEENYDALLNLITSDINIASKTIETCNLKDSFLYVLSLIYFELGYLARNTSLTNRFSATVVQYLNLRNCLQTIPDNIMKEMLAVPFIKDRMTAALSSRVSTAVKDLLSNNKLIEGFNIDFKWKM